ncbi:MAG: lysine--tRNA ligase [Patescibacteria group bacterium]|nr:lysine--tRNA ligase [Patescibacteria group bacterium]
MSRLEEEFTIRKEKRLRAEKAGLDLYPATTSRSHSISQVIEQFPGLVEKGKVVTVAGRIRSFRLHGGSAFCTIQDSSGSLQIYFKKDSLGSGEYEQLKEYIDIGDFIEASGKLFTTHRGEKTLLSSTYKILTKSLLPLPEKWHGLSDIEIRYRKRYLDLISNPSIRTLFENRSRIITTIRTYLSEAGFIEVETPILQPIPGGANARPFSTYHNALEQNLFLRIAPELYLKRLIIGGFEKVFEISRCFRNEGIDRDHNPEFTQVELYAAYWDYTRLIRFAEELLRHIVVTVLPSSTLETSQHIIEFEPAFSKITFADAFQKHTKLNVESATDDEIRSFLKSKRITFDPKYSRAKLLDEVFKECIRPFCIQPTFIIDYPVELSPLAKRKRENKNFVERFQLVVAGVELCNAFSELNDPIDQADRFKIQDTMRKKGDEEAQQTDADFIEALSHGMPPTAGIGIGIDRLTALLLGAHSIKEVILFPTLKGKP